jgi:ABC-type Fe3+-hydroxamate transport system substrate-binding protein
MTKFPLTRRKMIAGLAAVPSLVGSAPASAPRIVCLDDGLAETMLAIGAPPIAITDRDAWEKWVVEPKLPDTIVDLGLALEPNLELMQQLRPDLILSIPYLAGIRSQLERVAPVTYIGIYVESGNPYERAVEATRKLGSVCAREQEAEALIAATGAELAKLSHRLARFADRPLYLVRFNDPRNIWVFGPTSMFQCILDRVGLRNAWTRETNEWGFSATGIDALGSAGNARLAYLEPLPRGATGTLTESPVWNAMPFVRDRAVLRVPVVQAFGALPSALRFARLLANALETAGA